MNHFEIGDLVLITKESNVGGVWINLMDKTIGQIAKISGKKLINIDAIYVDVIINGYTYHWLYPTESLKKIELKDKADNQAFQDLIQV